MNEIDEVMAEIARATRKFPTWPTDPLHALAVLGEEYGELTKAILQHTYEPQKSTRQDVREEAIQTAAMAIRLLMSLDRYEYAPCVQHEQQIARGADMSTRHTPAPDLLSALVEIRAYLSKCPPHAEDITGAKWGRVMDLSGAALNKAEGKS